MTTPRGRVCVQRLTTTELIKEIPSRLTKGFITIFYYVSKKCTVYIYNICFLKRCYGRGLCDELITRPEESYRRRCVVVCDLETS
jgi:hypothetical protein